MCVVSVIVSCLYDLDVRFGYCWLLCEFLLEEVCHKVEVSAEQPADETQGEHITTFQHGFVVHACICESVLDHLGYRACYDTVRVNAHFSEVVFCLELCLLEVFLSERVSVDYYCCLWFRVTVLSLQCRCVHGNEDITLVSRCVHTSFTDMHLES